MPPGPKDRLIALSVVLSTGFDDEEVGRGEDPHGYREPDHPRGQVAEEVAEEFQ